jgi:GT2 family glycosyltransferase
VIDVIVPNYNGIHHLAICFDALRRQMRHADMRVVMVDDASTDDSVAFVRANYPEVHIIVMPQNGGFVASCNAAIAASQAEYVVLLNNDTEVTPIWLAELVGALEQHPEYDIAASKLMLFDRRDVIHSAGDFYRVDGIPGNRGVWQNDALQYQMQEEVFGACAGASAYRRRVIDMVSVDGHFFDPDLVMYCEDVDLNLRARLHGLRTVFVPTAVVYHRLSATGGGALASYYCGRNFALVWLKNMPDALLRRYLGVMIWRQLALMVDSVRHIRGQAARARLRGQWHMLGQIMRFWHKRRAIPADVDEAQLLLTHQW